MQSIINVLWKDITIVKLPYDINGNPRYYIELVAILKYIPDHPKDEPLPLIDLDDKIDYINRKKYLLSKYKGKKYWYWYVIQSYSLATDLVHELSEHILDGAL